MKKLTIAVLFFVLFLVLPSFVLADTATINLKTGWNMISPPLLASEANLPPKNFFSQLGNKFEAIYRWDNEWASYFNGMPDEFDQIRAVLPMVGYWVKVRENCSLTYEGIDPQITIIQLYGPNSWNLIGTPNNYVREIDPVISPIGNSVGSVYYFENGDWKIYIPTAPWWVNDLKELRSKRAYWVYVKPESLVFDFWSAPLPPPIPGTKVQSSNPSAISVPPFPPERSNNWQLPKKGEIYRPR